MVYQYEEITRHVFSEREQEAKKPEARRGRGRRPRGRGSWSRV
jgi:hypothetical protein